MNAADIASVGCILPAIGITCLRDKSNITRGCALTTASIGAEGEIAIARRGVRPGPVAHRGVVVAGGDGTEGEPTDGIVEQAGGVGKQRSPTDGVARVAGGGVISERLKTDGHVAIPGGVDL